jgi:hypothetical protein
LCDIIILKNKANIKPAPSCSCIVVVEDLPLETLDVLVTHDSRIAYLWLGVRTLLVEQIESEKTIVLFKIKLNIRKLSILLYSNEDIPGFKGERGILLAFLFELVEVSKPCWFGLVSFCWTFYIIDKKKINVSN